MNIPTNIVFVHGYSVTNLDTYGELPLRLRNEAKLRGLQVRIEEIFLGRYISFDDEVRLNDISRALENAIQTQMPELIQNKEKFACITHSTGGPVVRNWFSKYYAEREVDCPLSHLIMLAPANFGSALAQLGKGKLSRLKSWFDGVEPGQLVLDWLELGSAQAWSLNKEWIEKGDKFMKEKSIFPFVLTGQSIDRKLYDNLNTYTGELGSDGVVRVSAANLNGTYIRLEQQKENLKLLNATNHIESVNTAFRIVRGKSHSGDEKGILKSVLKGSDDAKSKETVDAIFDCLNVSNRESYNNLCKKFKNENVLVQQEEAVEEEKNLLQQSRYFFHDIFSQVIFKVVDSEGYAVRDYDLILTAGKENSANHLPEGFAKDRQKNRTNGETITYYFNWEAMNGATERIDSSGKVARLALEGTDSLGLQIVPRPDEGFVRYSACAIKANRDLLAKALKPNSSTLIEIVLQRQVSKEVFGFEKVDDEMPTSKAGDFSKLKPGKEIIN